MNMPVILLVSLDFDAGLINGSQGVVVGFEKHDPAELPDVVGSYRGRRKGLINVFARNAVDKEWPIIQFPDAGGQQRTIYPCCMMSELGNGGRPKKEEGEVEEEEEEELYSLFSRTQIPLLAAWAITIHKSQGMTLSQMEVDLSRAFLHPQRYVALSRVREPEGLTVIDLGDCTAAPNAEVMKFFEETGLLNREHNCDETDRNH